jgi:integrase
VVDALARHHRRPLSSVRYKTLAYYRTTITEYLVPGLGAHKIDRLEPEHIEKLYARLRKEGTQPATLQQIHRTLRVALNEATRRGRIGRNPIAPVKAPSIIEKEIEPLFTADAHAILTVAADRRNGARWAIALSLGLRQGEALGLQWPDIEITWQHGCGESNPCGASSAADCPAKWPRGTLTVRRALQQQSWQYGCDPTTPCGRARGADCPARHSGGLIVVEPKSRAGRRALSLPTPLIGALLAHRQTQDAERTLAAELWQDGQWVFTQPTGRPIDPLRVSVRLSGGAPVAPRW